MMTQMITEIIKIGKTEVQIHQTAQIAQIQPNKTAHKLRIVQIPQAIHLIQSTLTLIYTLTK